MDPTSEIEDLLKENLRLSRENNRLLRKMRRTHLMDVISRIIFFLFIIGVPLFVYRYYLADYIQQLQQTYRGIKSSMADITELPAQLLSDTVVEELDTMHSPFE